MFKAYVFKRLKVEVQHPNPLLMFWSHGNNPTVRPCLLIGPELQNPLICPIYQIYWWVPVRNVSYAIVGAVGVKKGLKKKLNKNMVNTKVKHLWLWGNRGARNVQGESASFSAHAVLSTWAVKKLEARSRA